VLLPALAVVAARLMVQQQKLAMAALEVHPAAVVAVEVLASTQ
jgi:hypothetical protein